MGIPKIITISILLLLFIYGIYSAFWIVPAQDIEIQNLKNHVAMLKAKITQYKIAMKFENLFMLGASPNDVMRFEGLEKYIKERKEFYEKIQLQKGPM